MKIPFPRIGRIALILAAAIGLTVMLLYIPFTGNWIGRHAIRSLGKMSGLVLEAERVRLSFPLDLSLYGLTAGTQGEDADTLGSLRHLRVRIRPGALLGNIIAVDTFRLEGLRLATGSFLGGVELQGDVETLSAGAMVRMAGRRISFRNLLLSEAGIILRIDSLQEGESEPSGWLFDAGSVRLQRIRFDLRIPGDSLSMSAAVGLGELTQAGLSPDSARYTAGSLRLEDARLAFDTGEAPPAEGPDPRHLLLTGLNLMADSLVYRGREMHVRILALSVAERSGLEVVSAEGSLQSDSLRIRIPALQLQTGSSSAGLQASVPWNAWSERPEGDMQLRLTASAGKRDLLLFARTLPAGFRDAWPEAPLALTVSADGNPASLHVRELKAELPGAFLLKASGEAGRLTDSLLRSAQMQVEAEVQMLDFVRHLLPDPLRERFRIPQGLALSGQAGLKDRTYGAELFLRGDSAGRIALKGLYRDSDQRYEAALSVDSLRPVCFLPGDSLMRLSATLRVEGRGADLFADSARSVWEGRVADLQYASSELKNIRLSASLADHRVQAGLKSDCPAARLAVDFDGSLYPGSLKGMWTGSVDTLDLQRLHLTDMTCAASFQLFAEMETDFGRNHLADLTLGNWELKLPDRSVRPKMLTLHLRTGRDTTRLSLHVDDLGVILTGNADAETVIARIGGIAEGVRRQIADSDFHIAALRPLLPDMRLTVHAEKDNPVYSILRQYDLDMDAFRLDASASPAEGLRMDAALYTLYRDTFRIDTLRAAIRPDSAGLKYRVEVIKNRYRRQEPFTAAVSGSIGQRYADAEFRYADSRNETGLDLGVRGSLEEDGLLLRLFPENPVVAFHTFRLNPDNYIRYRHAKDVEADVRFIGADHSAFLLHSVREEDALPEVHAELNRIDMETVSQGFAGMPRLKGLMSADLRYAPSPESFMVVADAHVDRLVYEGGEVGELLLNTIYLPLDGKTHQVDAHFYRNRQEAASATAVYDTERRSLSGQLAADSLPLEMWTPFIPDGMASLNGALNGRLRIEGSPAAPVVNGYLRIDTGSVYAALAASRFRLDSARLEIRDSRAIFNRFRLFAAGTEPLELDGEIRFDDPAHIETDLRLTGRNFRALDVAGHPESLVYGRLFADATASLKGPPDALVVRGDIRLLGGTDFTCVIRESPLTVQDRLKDLVVFTSFADTTLRRRRTGRPAVLPAGGTDIVMQVHIDPSVRLNADLTPDRSSYVALEGGGDLAVRYTPRGEILLNGRYTLSGGRLKYALPVIPLKEFGVKDGSYIQWDGDPFNPILGLEAVQRMRASVSLPGESPRMVNFDVGVDVRQRLENMALRFTVAAPDDRAVQEDIDKAGEEGRSTLAVGMMMTGMYLAGGGAGKMNLNMGSALGGFLQNEIRHIAGDALKTVDFSFGMDTYSGNAEAGGGERTDYSFRLARRFYNDRLRVVIGGKVSAGDVRQKESFIDNASLEWRLNRAGTGYLRLFHDKNYQSILDGEVTETGLGLLFRRRMQRWHELFRMK
jgi:hypothetical protein